MSSGSVNIWVGEGDSDETGCIVGGFVTTIVGLVVGGELAVGDGLGFLVVGFRVGCLVGKGVGILVGRNVVGGFVGEGVGFLEGFLVVGFRVGRLEGKGVGE
jgi:hypothetical protein